MQQALNTLLRRVCFLFVIVLFTFVASGVSAQERAESTCTMNVKAGWNLQSMGSVVCGLATISRNGGAELFPAYLDLYAYNGTDYTHARITKQSIQGGRSPKSLELGVEKYSNARVRKFTNNQFDSYRGYTDDAKRNIDQNNTEKIEEYAARLAREVFTSVWVYNPGKEFTVRNTAHYQGDAVLLAAVNLLFSNMSNAEYTQFVNYVQNEVAQKILNDAERYPGSFALVRNLFSGRIAIDKGWNFLSYSKALKDENNTLNFTNGNCNITKTWVFDNESKKWVQTSIVSESLLGSGMIVYNNGAPCTWTVKNSIVSTFRSIFTPDGSDNAPPQLPE